MLPSQEPTAGFDFPELQHLQTINVVASSAATYANDDGNPIIAPTGRDHRLS